MQAIITKYVPPTNTKPSRIKAVCERGSITISFPHEFTIDKAHAHVAGLLCARFVQEDIARYGSDASRNPWAKPFVTGQIPSGAYVHVFTA